MARWPDGGDFYWVHLIFVKKIGSVGSVGPGRGECEECGNFRPNFCLIAKVMQLRNRGGSAAKGGSPHSRFAVVSPTRALHQDTEMHPFY
ncbi:hypothetical protein LYNGBM3L_68400 [Moorena producens 3L]|uniref:Uncharacterized protein n=1 Tax=Moorena producens 3L TaxID=489825 RepID=F4Y2T7_9CYAN|nr:hypothetical protein LYNGBM3L_68400 [Moorena producens 3L]